MDNVRFAWGVVATHEHPARLARLHSLPLPRAHEGVEARSADHGALVWAAAPVGEFAGVGAPNADDPAVQAARKRWGAFCARCIAESSFDPGPGELLALGGGRVVPVATAG